MRALPNRSPNMLGENRAPTRASGSSATGASGSGVGSDGPGAGTTTGTTLGTPNAPGAEGEYSGTGTEGSGGGGIGAPATTRPATTSAPPTSRTRCFIRTLLVTLARIDSAPTGSRTGTDSCCLEEADGI